MILLHPSVFLHVYPLYLLTNIGVGNRVNERLLVDTNCAYSQEACVLPVSNKLSALPGWKKTLHVC